MSENDADDALTLSVPNNFKSVAKTLELCNQMSLIAKFVKEEVDDSFIATSDLEDQID